MQYKKKRFVIGSIGIIVLLVMVGIGVQKNQFNQQVDDQLKALFAPILEDTVVEVEEETLCLQYVGGELLEHGQVLIQFEVYKEHIAPKTYLGLAYYRPYVTSEKREGTYTILNDEGHNNIAILIEELSQYIYREYLKTQGTLINLAFESLYDKEEVYYDQTRQYIEEGKLTGEGTLTGSLMVGETGEEETFIRSWKAIYSKELGEKALLTLKFK